MIRSIRSAVMAVVAGVAVLFAPVAHAAAVPAAAAGGVIAKAVAPLPSANGQPQSTTQMLHLAQRRGRFRRGRRGFRRGLRRRGFRRGYRRGYRRGRRRGRRWVGPAIGAGIAALIIGGAIASSKERYRDRWERCDDDFRTFRWSDGTYIPYVGSPRVLCPYLRR